MKRLFDFFFSLLLLICFSWLLLLLFLLVKLCLGSPALFQQPRIGYREKVFTVYKFRSMSNAKDANGNLLSDQARLTKFGRFLRSSSLDELPQLFNIIRGDMSFVGPRPLLVEYLPLYNIEQKRRHLVRPGITGWAQVNGRNAISWQEKFKLDCWYVDHRSFWLDGQILKLTIKKVFRRDGINQQGQSTMDKFNGK